MRMAMRAGPHVYQGLRTAMQRGLASRSVRESLVTSALPARMTTGLLSRAIARLRCSMQ